MKAIDSLYIIDSDRIAQFIIKTYTMARSFAKQTQAFSDAPAALDELHRSFYNTAQLPDMILMDIYLPEMTGWHFLEEFGKLSPWLGKDIPIFLLTSSIRPEDRQKAKGYKEVRGYYVKPINEELIINIFSTP